MSVTTIPDVTEELPGLYADQTEDVILGRLRDSANEGLDPVADAEQWVDTREGGHWYVAVIQAVREMARLYDLVGSEVVMSAFVLWAWEVYLDDLAAAFDVVRLAAASAQGTVTFTGPSGTVIAAGTTVGVEPSTPDDPTPEFEVTTAGTIPVGGSIDLPVQATPDSIGAQGNVAAGAITGAPITPIAGVTATNAAALFGGRDVENDEGLRKRTLDAIAGKGPGAVRDYVRWAGDWPGVGMVKVVPVWNGAGTVLVMVADPDGQPLPSALTTALQNDLDPVAGQGSGTAPVGATVSVETSTLLTLAVNASLTFDAGYSWTGTGGTVAVQAPIEAALTRYLLSIPPGGEIVYEHVKGIFATYPGVHDVTALTMDTGGAPGTANLPVADYPTPQVPVLGTVTIS